MRTLVWCLLAVMLMSASGCGGGGSGVSLAEMKRLALRSSDDEEETPRMPALAPAEPEHVVAAEPAPTPPVPAPMPMVAATEPMAAPPVALAPEPTPAQLAPSPSTTPDVAAVEPTTLPAPMILPSEGPPDLPLTNEGPRVASLDPLDRTKPAVPPVTSTEPAAPAESKSETLASDARHPLPDADSQKGGKRILAELYQADYEQARTAAQKVALAKRLLAKAEEIQSDVVGHYLLLNLVRDLGLKAGDVSTSMQAIDLLNTSFQFDGPTERFKTLDKLSKTLASDADAKLFLQESHRLLQDVCAKNDFELALKVYESALVVAKRNNKQVEIGRLTSFKKVLEEAKAAYTTVPNAEVTLKQDPIQAESHLAVGRYVCLYKRDWEQGLPHLAQSSDIKLKVLAQIDLSQPKQAQQQADLGDQWYELALDARPFARSSLALRAAHWYAAAFSALPSGLIKTRVQKRLQEIADLTGDTSLQAFASAKKALPQD